MLAQLNITRFIAALLIVFFHFRSEAPFAPGSSLARLAVYGNLGASYFFVLSGFVLAVKYCTRKPERTSAFFRRRILRIYPLYALALALFIVLLGVDLSKRDAVAKVVLNLLLLQSWIPPYPLSLNYPGWFLSDLLFFSLLFPILLNFLLSLTRPALFLVVLLLWSGSYALHLTLLAAAPAHPFVSYDLIFYHPLFHLNEFVAGMAGGIVLKRMEWKPAAGTAIAGIAASIVTIAATFFTGLPLLPHSNSEAHNGFLAPLFLLLLFSLSLDSSVLSRTLSRKFFVFLGEISFAIFLLQFPARELVRRALRGEAGTEKPVGFAVFLMTLLALSAGVHLLVERPIQRFLRKPDPHRTASQSTP